MNKLTQEQIEKYVREQNEPVIFNCIIRDMRIVHSLFHKFTFSNCVFEDVVFDKCTFDDCVFEDSKIIRCEYRNTIFAANAHFRVYYENVNFEKCVTRLKYFKQDIEFTQFDFTTGDEDEDEE